MSKKAQGFAPFALDLGLALEEQSQKLLFEKMDAVPLTEEAVNGVFSFPGRQDPKGVYLLEHRGKVVYVGKSDARHGLRGRLLRHVDNIQHRPNLNPSEVRFRAIEVLVFSPRDLEVRLMERFSPDGRSKPEWNTSGFGSNALGKERFTTEVHPDGFDTNHKISIDIPFEAVAKTGRPLFGEGTDVPAIELLRAFRSQLPYTFQFECLEKKSGRGADPNKPHPELLEAPGIHVLSTSMTTRQMLEAVCDVLPPNWQATRFPGFVTLYRNITEYEKAEGVVVARSPGSRTDGRNGD